MLKVNKFDVRNFFLKIIFFTKRFLIEANPAIVFFFELLRKAGIANLELGSVTISRSPLNLFITFNNLTDVAI